MSKVRKNILIICSCLLMVVGIFIALYIIDTQNNFGNEIYIKSDGKVKRTIEVSDLVLLPSESKEYEIIFNTALSGNFIVDLYYVETSDGGMSQFVDVVISCGDQQLYSGKLYSLFDEEVRFSLNIEKYKETKILITYSMDSEVGNEALNKYTDFKIELSVERDKG